MNILNLPDNFRTSHTPSTEEHNGTSPQLSNLRLSPERQRQSAAQRRALKAAQRERAKTLPPKLKPESPKPTICQLAGNLINARLAALNPTKQTAENNNATASSDVEETEHTTAYIQEWRDSCVSDAIIAANVEWLEGGDAVERLTADAIAQMGGHAQQYATKPVIRLFKRYETAREGGWWSSGIDILNNCRPMEWGQFKAINPRPSFKKDAAGSWSLTGKQIKYDAPAKQPTRAFFAAVSASEIATFCDRHRLKFSTVIKEIEECQKALGIESRRICMTEFFRHGISTDFQAENPSSSLLRSDISTDSRQNAPTSESISHGHSLLSEPNQQQVSQSLKSQPTEGHIWTYPGFWEWIKTHSEIPVTITEGNKKAGASITTGDATIALPGVFNGYRSKDKLGNPIDPYLIDDIKAIAQSGRPIRLAFDQDEKPETARKVAVALSRFGQLLKAQGCEVRIVMWDSSQGKGIDDLIANHGPGAFHQAVNDALTLEEWQLWQALNNKLTLAPAIRLKVHDLTVLNPESIPTEGIIALASGKGTGKTNLMARLIADTDKVLSAGHRISLQRHLCERFNINYRGDLDKQGGRFFDGNGYTLRLATVVDSLLAINPVDFEGCDLLLDEVCQLLRHLLTSSTCNKDGKRPVLLMRFRELIRAARRVIIADADIDDKAIAYIQNLRGDGGKPFLVQNDFKGDGYPVRFIESSDASAITGELLDDLKAGDQLFIATDSKQASKRLHQMIEQLLKLDDDQLLLINSETSSLSLQKAFMEAPDRHLDAFSVRVVTASPSTGTGLSIESDHFDKVYGIFYGTSITDADMAQALIRVRANIPRVVWCAKYGRSFSKVGRHTSALKLLDLLKQKTDANTLLIRSSLSELACEGLTAHDWQNDPHTRYWAQIEAERNRSMWNLRTALKVRLMHEGHQVDVVQLGKNGQAQALLKAAREELKIEHALAIEAADNLDPAQAKALDQLEGLDEAQRRALQKWKIAEFYCVPIEQVDADLVLWDNDGRRRGQLLNLEGLLYEGVAIDADVRSLEQQAKWTKNFTQKGYTPWDIGNASLKRWMRQKLGLDAYLEHDGVWDAETLTDFKEKALSLAPQIKAALNFSVRVDMAPVQILNQLLEQMGLKSVRSQPMKDGKRISIYRLCPITQRINHEILERRKARREKLSGTNDACTPSSYIDHELKGCAGQQAPQIEDSGAAAMMARLDRPDVAPVDGVVQKPPR